MFGVTFSIFTQLIINNFSSTSTPDWVEIVNESEVQVNFDEYLIIDTAGNDVLENILIPPKGNCVFDWSNKLNNAGDEIILKKGDQEVDCVKYGNSEGKCSDSRAQTDTKPPSSCFEATSTPAPTVILTPPPTPVRTQTPIPTLQPTYTPENNLVLAANIEKPTPEPTPTEEVIIIGSESKNFLPLASMLGGLAISGGSLAVVLKKEYNERHPPTTI